MAVFLRYLILIRMYWWPKSCLYLKVTCFVWNPKCNRKWPAVFNVFCSSIYNILCSSTTHPLFLWHFSLYFFLLSVIFYFIFITHCIKCTFCTQWNRKGSTMSCQVTVYGIVYSQALRNFLKIVSSNSLLSKFFFTDVTDTTKAWSFLLVLCSCTRWKNRTICKTCHTISNVKYELAAFTSTG